MYSTISFGILTVITIWTLTVHALLFLGRATNNPSLEFYGRTLASFAALLICATYGTVASAALNVVGYGGLGQWTTARAFKWIMLLFTGVWCEIEDENDYLNKTRPAVFVGNHQTELDVLFLGHVFPPYCSVTAKKSLKYTPVLGWFMALSKTVFIERTSRDQAVAAFDNAAAQMKSARQSVYIFAEGTRSYFDYPDLLPYKKGAFHLAVQAQVPIVPIVVANYANVLNIKKRIFRPGVVPIKILAPIETKGKTKADVDDLLKHTRDIMLVELKAITAKAQKLGTAPNADESSGKTNGSHKTSKAIEEVVNAAA